MTQHAFLAPSAAARWVLCPGSALLESRYPEQGDRAAAEEGDAAHWVFAQMWDGYAPEVLLADGFTDKRHPITRGMVEGARLLIDDIRATCVATGTPLSQVCIEQPVPIQRVHPSACWGTPDVAMRGARTLYAWEYKFGHKQIEVFENRQLLCYAAGLIGDEDAVVLRVVQPRAYHREGPIREWRLSAKQLADYVFRLSMAADEAMQPTPECRPTPAACENCHARHACDALQRASYRGMALAQQAQAGELSPAALGLELRYLTDAQKLMESRITGLRAQAEALLRGAVPVPHFKMEAAGARVKWAKPDAEVIALGEMLGLSLAKPPEAVTPTQAKAAGFPPSLLGAYSFTPSGAMRLVVDDGSDARKIFQPE